MSLAAKIFATINASKMKKFADIPGPTPTFPLGNAAEFLGVNPWDVTAEYGAKYGGMTLIWLLNEPVIVLNDAELIGDVLEGNWLAYYKDQPREAFEPIIKNSLFLANGEDWKFSRTNDPFSQDYFQQWLTNQVAPMREVINQFITEIEDRKFDTQQTMMRVIFDAFSAAVWGQVFKKEVYEWFECMANEGNWRVNSKLPLIPPINPFFLADRKAWYDKFGELVTQGQNNPDPKGVDLLNTVVRHGTKFNHEQLTVGLANIYFGGGFSAPTGISTTLYLLARHPEALKRVVNEVKAMTAANPNFDFEALEGCIELKKALYEALRYLAPVPFYTRNVQKDKGTTLGGHDLPANTPIWISNWFLQRDPNHWPNPETYDPQRWTPEVFEANPLGSGYFFPFGRGPRTCMGMYFALMSMKLTLATILSRVNFVVGDDVTYKQDFFFGVMMPKDMTAHFEPNP